MPDQPEAWMRGPVPEVPGLLQPVAHTLIQVREEAGRYLSAFPESLLWERPAGVASVGFHLQHIGGVIDRLLTYARGEALSAEQFAGLAAEGKDTSVPLAALLGTLNHRIDAALEQIRHTDPATLTDFRGVGRKQLPSTVIGLLFHAAEHSMRHTGQLLVTARLLTGKSEGLS